MLTEHFSLQDCAECGVTNVMLVHSDGMFFSRGLNGFDPSVLFPVRHVCIQQIKGHNVNSNYTVEDKQHETCFWVGRE